jgi:hypothetical protein
LRVQKPSTLNPQLSPEPRILKPETSNGLGIRWRQRPHKDGASTQIRPDPRLSRGGEGHGDRGGEGYLGEEGDGEEGGGEEGGGEGGGDCVRGAHLHLSLPALKLDLLQVCCEGVCVGGG